MVASSSNRHEFQEVEKIVLHGQFWVQVRYVLQVTKPIYNMIQFQDTNQLMIGEVHEQRDNILSEIKDIVS